MKTRFKIRTVWSDLRSEDWMVFTEMKISFKINQSRFTRTFRYKIVTKSCFSSELNSCKGVDDMELCNLSTTLIEPSDICIAGPYSMNAMSEQKLVAINNKYDLSVRFTLRRSSRIIYKITEHQIQLGRYNFHSQHHWLTKNILLG